MYRQNNQEIFRKKYANLRYLCNFGFCRYSMQRTTFAHYYHSYFSTTLFLFRTALPVCLVHLRIKNLQRTSFGKVPPFVQGGRVFFPPAAEPHFWWLAAKRILQEIKPATHCNTLQHTAPYCNALQHTPQHIATYSNILHQMARNSIL